MSEKANLPDIPWKSGISRMDDDLLKARLSNLSADAQIEVAASLGWDDRLRVIRNSDAAREIVQGLPAEEVFLTVKSAEEGDALLLVGLTSPDQLRFILDMELWAGDRLDVARARQWLTYILACGEEKVIEFLEHSDRELQTIMMSKLLTLVPNEEGVTVPQGLPSIMPDEFFTILSSVPEETENIRLLLRIIRQWGRDRFYELLFDIYGRSGPEAEEEALRWRNSRLEEKGLLEFDEAIEIYAYIGESEAREIADKALAGGSRTPGTGDEVAEEVAPVYPMVLAEPRTLLYRTLRSIEDLPEQNRLRSELAFSANRLLVADAERIGEIDAMKSSLKRLFSLANVGLLFLSGGEGKTAEGIVKSLPVKELFQIGFSRVADLGSIARKIAAKWWPAWRETGFLLLGLPGEEVLSGALKRIPQFYDLPESGRPGFRDFVTFEEVARTRRTLEETDVVAETLFDHLGLPLPHTAEIEPGDVFAGGLEDITMSSLLLTGFVHFTLKGSFEMLPLTPEDLDGMFGVVLERSSSGDNRIRPEAVDGFLSWLAGQTGFEATRLQALTGYVKAAAAGLEEEVGGLGSAGEFDPRYVRSIIVTGRR
jgi:hypothetical protein